jgi:glycogen debranching enzyme
MLYSALKWLGELQRSRRYKHTGVETDEMGSTITWSDWASLIKRNFEHCYYVPRTRDEDGDYDINSSIVNRRGIYKDLHRSGKPYEDYQLRPNFPIAMAVAPELFDPERALYALYMCDTILLGPTGMATLDPSDLNYRPHYNNGEDSTDFHTSKGLNYHSGPEWIWPRGFFLRALLKFDLKRRKTPEERVESFQQITRRLSGCMEMIKTTPWAGLTELTNKNGAFCGDSCPTQAWSSGCLIDLFREAKALAEHYDQADSA